jgi:hypothetical protein
MGRDPHYGAQMYRQSNRLCIHQFVRSLEALLLPDIRKTKSQFAHRCQTFARAGDDTRALLLEVDPTLLSPGAICLQLARFNGILHLGGSMLFTDE